MILCTCYYNENKEIPYFILHDIGKKIIITWIICLSNYVLFLDKKKKKKFEFVTKLTYKNIMNKSMIFLILNNTYLQAFLTILFINILYTLVCIYWNRKGLKRTQTLPPVSSFYMFKHYIDGILIYDWISL